MFSRKQLEDILFLDIETASVTEKYDQLPERLREHWDKKSEILRKREEQDLPADELFTQRAAIFAEFGKVVCVSCGYIRFYGDQPRFRVKSWFGADEKEILTGTATMLNQFMSQPTRNICAHNGKEFDLPYLGRRYLINGMQLPDILKDIQGKKPWEVRLIDTMNFWKFGDFKSFTSLDLLTTVLDIPSPKDDIDGSEVGRVFWEQKDYARIAKYCEKDVVATAQVVLRFSGEPLIEEGTVESV